MTATIYFKNPNTTIGIGSSQKIVNIVDEIGATNILIVTDKGVLNAGLIDNIKSSLEEKNYKTAIFSDCVPNSPSSIVEKLSQSINIGHHDLLIGIGGGSTMDTTKAASILAPNNISFQDFINGKPASKSIPKILVPTTSGTGSEWDEGALLADELAGQKRWIKNDCFFADAVVIDAGLTLNLPQVVTAETGMDALTHAIEAYINPDANIISDMFAEKAIELISSNLRLVFARGNKSIEARYKMAFASAIGMKASAMSGSSIGHAMNVVLVNDSINHAVAVIILLPHVMQFELIATPERFAKIANLMGEHTNGLSIIDAAQKSVEAVKTLSKDVGLPQTLSEVGISQVDIPSFIDNLMENRFKVIQAISLREVSRADLNQIFNSAL
ncbi:iron-containing alcohol dehydrogenase [Chloroflexota bacterium]